MLERRDEDKVNRHIRRRIKEARAERGISQKELARRVYKSRVTISDLERGRVQINASDLALIAHSLDKPISYFYPPQFRGADPDQLSPDEQELIHWFQKIWQDHLRSIAVDQVRTLAESATKADLQAIRRDAE